MSSNQTFRPDLKRKAKAPFENAAGELQPVTPRRVMNTRVRNAVQDRSTQAREKLRNHIEKMKPRWIAREEGKLRRTLSMRMAHARSSGPKPPYGVSNLGDAHAQSVRERAQANVNRRCESRMKRLKSIEKRMVRDLTRSHSRSR